MRWLRTTSGNRAHRLRHFNARMRYAHLGRAIGSGWCLGRCRLARLCAAAGDDDLCGAGSLRNRVPETPSTTLKFTLTLFDRADGSKQYTDLEHAAGLRRVGAI